MVAPVYDPVEEPCIGLPLEATQYQEMSHPETLTVAHELEARVRQLEEQIQSLSKLLQRQQPSPITPPASPGPGSSYDTYLESPANFVRPMARANPERRRRNLSFQLLHTESTFEKLYPTKPSTATREDSTALDSQTTASLSEAPSASSLSPPPVSTTDFTADDDNQLETSPRYTTAASFASATSYTTACYQEITEETPPLAPPSGGRVVDTVDIVKSKWLDYLNCFQESDHDIDKQMEEFVKVPSALERLMSFGFWICVDSFLYVLTILPIRFAWSCLLLCRYVVDRLLQRPDPDGPYRFQRRHCYQLMQVSIIYTVYRYVLMQISIGKFYHWIRGQAMVKLYLLIAIVEVFDRLLCSLGQDCLDSLYWNTTRRPRSTRLVVSFVVALTYTAVHSFLLFVHVATLNVAMNSDDQALISLLIGGGFAEIKSTVFKKYNKANLFKITASDICERFKIALFLALVLTLNFSQGMDDKMVTSYVHMCGIVWAAEWLSDWIKHSFITKFNAISSGIYPEYALLLAGDVTGFGHEGVNLDKSRAVVKRIGFSQLPLFCVMARYLTEAHKYATLNNDLVSRSPWVIGMGLISVWLLLLAGKLSLGSFLQRNALAKLQAAPVLSCPNKKNR